MQDHQTFLRNWRRKLIFAWKNGLDDHDAANRLGIDYEELEQQLACDSKLRQLRDKNLDELTRIAKDQIAQKIKSGDRQTCEWYLEKRCPEFGAKIETNDDEGPEDDGELDDFLDGFQAKPGMFEDGDK